MNPARQGTAAPSPEIQRREHDRYVVEIPCLLRVQEIHGGTHRGTYGVTVLDLSQVGLRVTCPRALPSGSRVEITFLNAKIMGSVRYARDVEREFYLGIEADSVETSTARLTAPELDLIALFQADRRRLRRL
jgi:hypothetical protein